MSFEFEIIKIEKEPINIINGIKMEKVLRKRKGRHNPKIMSNPDLDPNDLVIIDGMLYNNKDKPINLEQIWVRDLNLRDGKCITCYETLPKIKEVCENIDQCDKQCFPEKAYDCVKCRKIHHSGDLYVKHSVYHTDGLFD